MLEDIKLMVKLQLGVEVVHASDRLMEDLGAESVDIANIIAALEARYAIEVKESEIAHLIKVSDFFDLVQRHRRHTEV